MEQLLENLLEDKIKECNTANNFDQISTVTTDEIFYYKRVLKKTQLNPNYHKYQFEKYLDCMLDFEPTFKGRFFRTIKDPNCLKWSFYSGTYLAFISHALYGDTKHLLWIIMCFVYFAISMLFKPPQEKSNKHNSILDKYVSGLPGNEDNFEKIYSEDSKTLVDLAWAVLSNRRINLQTKVRFYSVVSFIRKEEKGFKAAIRYTMKDINFGFGNICFSTTIVILAFISGDYSLLLFALFVFVLLFVVGVFYNKN